MNNAVKIFLVLLISAANVVRADEPTRDALIQRAYRTRNRHILEFIREQERERGSEGLRDPNFRAELKGKLDILVSEDNHDTEAGYCVSCERSRAQFNESEVRRLRSVLAASEQNQSMQMGQSFGLQQQPNFGLNLFGTMGSMNQGFTAMGNQMFGGQMGGIQNYQMGFGSPYQNYQFPNYANQFGGNQWNQYLGNQWNSVYRLNQSPLMVGMPTYSYGQSPTN